MVALVEGVTFSVYHQEPPESKGDEKYVCLFSKCEDADQFNLAMMERLGVDVVEVKALVPEEAERPARRSKKKTTVSAARMRKKAKTAGLEEVCE
ncbi:MAG: hypothetical protein GY740_23500 [Gammaproteobacteria bacterium]|nr:hypothetical protein [Gammaproteobacteria bacterium]